MIVIVGPIVLGAAVILSIAGILSNAETDATARPRVGVLGRWRGGDLASTAPVDQTR